MALEGCVPQVRYSCIEGDEVWEGVGNINADPLLGRWEGGEVRVADQNELEEASKLYIGSEAGAKLVEEENTLYLSMVFKWYKKDFTETGKSIPEFVLQYFPDDGKDYLKSHLIDIKVKYLEYDWSLNVSDEVE